MLSQAPGMVNPVKLSAAVRQGEAFALPVVPKPAVPGTWTYGLNVEPIRAQPNAWAHTLEVTYGTYGTPGCFPQALPNWVWARVLPRLDLRELLTLASCRYVHQCCML